MSASPVLNQLLRTTYPLIQAPMAGGPGTPALIAAVADAGGLGSLAAGYLSPEALRMAIAEVRALTDRPFAVNLFAHTPAPVDADKLEWARMLLAPYCRELDIEVPHDLSPPVELGEQLEVVLSEGIDIVSFAFGLPNAEQMFELREAGVTILGTATHLLEALVLESSGVDAIVAQGAEAGGHRGGFIGDGERVAVGTMALVPLLTTHLKVPVIAAGGLMDGRGIAAAMMLGASGVQLGTAFLACPEAGTPVAWREALLSDGNELATVLTRVFSGRPARGLANRLTRELAADAADLPAFPLQHQLTSPLRQAATQLGRAEFLSLWAGQGVSLLRTAPAAELIADWINAAESLLGRSLAAPAVAHAPCGLTID
ncbi:NAD(P)H-dependent flavin oxidoreductase [Plasticicumulans acidivorans]|uniref:Nitronate monooxygenase n=1 Tax=Plasticicumulans acidivorans TaxID=886464 RepID=A0A317MQ46_9GAMM|nr:nitronate monooxygenase [Plasticicumulans acidivorans]PWV58377.1 nitronate monooxygenase [Plasticicumulans acidivorans]